MSNEAETVEIQEPPLQELNKKRSCLKRSCITGCGCISIFFLACILILKFATSAPQNTIKNLPPKVANMVQLYDPSNIEKITYTSGKDRGKLVEVVAYVPKLVLTPFILILEKNSDASNSVVNAKWKQAVSLLSQPLADHRDKYTIEWGQLDASPNFIEEYYKTFLTKKGFEISQLMTSEKDKRLLIRLPDQEVDGILIINGAENGNGTKYVSMTLDINP